MPINPAIAMGVRGIELADPLAQYGRVAAIQGAQQQNQLAQLQMQQAMREQESTNALNAAYRDAYNPQTGDIDLNKLRQSLSAGGFGSKLPGIEKTLAELKKERLTQQKLEGEIAAQPVALRKLESEIVGQGLTQKKLEGEISAQPTAQAIAQANLVEAKLKQARSFLDTIDPTDPTAPEKYIAWHEANHRDPVLGPLLASRGITADQSRAQIAQAIQQGPKAFADLLNRSKLGTEKFMELNKPTTQVIDQSGQRQVIQIPGLGGAPTTVGTYADVPLPANVVAQKKEIARAGAPTTQVNVSTEKKYGERFGGLIADADAAKLAAAENAPNAAATADRVMDLIATGKVITGTGANARLQIAKALNLAGGTDSEKIRNTEVLISSLAETTLGAIKSSNLGAGQGFTNADRDFLEKAKAGQITYDSKSLTELARLSRLAAEKSAEAWNKRVQQIPASALEGTGISTQPVVVPPRRTASVMNIPQAAIDLLKSGGGTREQFDAQFGAGSAERVLGKGK